MMLVFTVIIQGKHLSESRATAAGYNQRREDDQTKLSSALIKDQRRFFFNKPSLVFLCQKWFGLS